MNNNLTNETVVDVQNLTKKFGHFTAVDDLTFSIRRGEIFGLLGANGAGKTTLIRMLCGLIFPTAGRAMVAGYDVLKEPDKVKNTIGYMSQKFSLYEDLTVWENIQFFGGIYGMDKATLAREGREMIRRLGLEKMKNRLIARLPLGWKQRIAFSVAILHKPGLVFLDEPTSGVDPVVRREFWEMIGETALQGYTLIVTTHYMDEAEYCRRVAIMHEGKIAALDKPAALKQNAGVQDMEELFWKITREGMDIRLNNRS